MTLTVHAEHPASGAAVHSRSLENGLRLVWEEDKRQPLAAIEVRIKGGVRAEGSLMGTGVTHFMEHMLFKGTPSRPPGSIDAEVRAMGGSINAFTSHDTTGITLYVGAEHLRQALDLVSDILQNAQFEAEEFEKERAVVLSEIHMNQDDPNRRLYRLFWSTHYQRHPYRHPVLGYESLLHALRVEDQRAYYAAQYQPDNIVLSVVGDFSGQDLNAWVDALFGTWERGMPDPLQSLVPEEPPIVSSRSSVDTMSIETGHVLLGFRSTALFHEDLYAMDVLAAILGQGRSSRLYQRLLRELHLVDSIAAWNYTPYDPGIFGIRFQADPDKIEAAKKAILDEIRKIQEKGVSREELNKAKRQTKAGYLFSLQTVSAKARDLASSVEATGDPLFSRRYVEAIQRVTAEDVQRAAREYLRIDRITDARILPSAPAATSPQAEKEQPDKVEKVVLGNGLTVLLGRDTTLPIVSMVAGFRGGLRVENEANAGISAVVAELLTKGTKRRSAEAIALFVESMGGALGSYSGYDGFGLHLQVLAEDWTAGLRLLHELLTESEFPASELDIQRRLALQQLQAQKDDIFQVAGNRLREAFFEDHSYRFNPLGSEESLKRMDRNACVAFSREWVVPSNGVLAVYGDIDPDTVAAHIEKTFGKMREGTVDWPQNLHVPEHSVTRTVIEPMEREQSVILIAFPGLKRTSEDRYALEILTYTLSGMAGRLFQNIREAHGLSYTLGASHRPGWDLGYVLVYAATKPEEKDRVHELMLRELQRFADEGIEPDELSAVKDRLIGAHRMGLQQLSAVAKRAVLDELYLLGYDDWQNYEQKIRAVGASAVQALAERLLRIDSRVEVIAGPEVFGSGTQGAE